MRFPARLTMARSTAATLTVGAAALLFLAGCGQDESDSVGVLEPEVAHDLSPLEYAEYVRDKLSVEAVWSHMESLQRIADENGGTRAAFTPGYEASLAMVADQLRGAGFEVETPEFEFERFQIAAQRVTLGGRDVLSRAMRYSPSTPDGGVAAELVVLPPGATGCTDGDYDDLDAAGGIVLVDRGECSFTEKQQAASDRGAIAVIIVNTEDTLIDGSLGSGPEARIPTVLTTRGEGERLRDAKDEDVTLLVDAQTSIQHSRSVVAQTRTGSATDVIVAGAHLDSVDEGPGINDNASGVAALLETALLLGPDPDSTHAVRFAFWGAEENGLVGSTDYVDGLSESERLDIALYLNFDMIASENAGYFVLDGEGDAEDDAEPGPEGSAGIEQLFRAYFESADIEAEGSVLDGRSDYAPFMAAGIPVGGIFTGADGVMTEAQAEAWGGVAGRRFDRNYHTDADTLENSNREALTLTAPAVAYAVAFYSQEIDGAYGVPARDDRELLRRPVS
ncbi:M28 family peptidase [Hoyosella altamirensis]|uniref:Zn-dependent M28 family amino/carboxypeptidase n=1 Tax=Hoyosella altamirensis TaxID=616997 RepID=A0A839RNC5_9ACTN|nr:M28 family peptidase [Hoyosella altamirensis]MBB3037566.1 Zn-dependent M28 family amino/carboxypeptidase [Hoyosella altamirensis]